MSTSTESDHAVRSTVLPSAADGAIAVLIEVVRDLAAFDLSGWTATPIRKRLEARRDRILALHDELRDPTATSDLELAHNEHRHSIGVDGLPVEQDSPRLYRSVIGDLSDLAETVQISIDELPHPKTKRALKVAALGLLHLIHEYSGTEPTVHLESPAVVFLEAICKAAGLERERETHKNALLKAIKIYDPQYLPDELERLDGYFKSPKAPNVIT